MHDKQLSTAEAPLRLAKCPFSAGVSQHSLKTTEQGNDAEGRHIKTNAYVTASLPRCALPSARSAVIIFASFISSGAPSLRGVHTPTVAWLDAPAEESSSSVTCGEQWQWPGRSVLIGCRWVFRLSGCTGAAPSYDVFTSAPVPLISTHSCRLESWTSRDTALTKRI